MVRPFNPPPLLMARSLREDFLLPLHHYVYALYTFCAFEDVGSTSKTHKVVLVDISRHVKFSKNHTFCIQANKRGVAPIGGWGVVLGKLGGARKLHPGFWKIPPMVPGPTRVLENSTQASGKVLGHNSDLVIEIYKSKKKCKM